MKSEGITIIVPVYDEEQVVNSTIKQINEVMLSTKLKYEVIVVNDGSTDSTRSILEKEKDTEEK